MAVASTSARRGEIRDAAAVLAEADRAAPLRVRLDPFARDLLTVLGTRAEEHGLADTLRALAAGTGVSPAGPR